MVLRIRAEFPDAEGQYVGFRPVLGLTLTYNWPWCPARWVYHTELRDLQGWVSAHRSHMGQGPGKHSWRSAPTVHHLSLQCNKQKWMFTGKLHYNQKALCCSVVKFLFLFLLITSYSYILPIYCLFSKPSKRIVSVCVYFQSFVLCLCVHVYFNLWGLNKRL